MALFGPHGPIYAKYGVQTTIYYALGSPTADRLYRSATVPVSADDIRVSKDGGGPVAPTNTSTYVGNGIYSLVLTATEMQATDIVISIGDNDASPVFADTWIHVKTKLQVGQVDIDASQLTNTTALSVLGVGSGHGANFVGGATGAGVRAEAGATSTWAGMHCLGGGGAGSAGIFGGGGASNGPGIQGNGQGTGAGLFAQGTGATGPGAYFLGNTSGAGLKAKGGATPGPGAEFLGGDTTTTAGSWGLFASGSTAGLAAYAASGSDTYGASFVGSGIRGGLCCQGGTGNNAPGARFISLSVGGPAIDLQTDDGDGIRTVLGAGAVPLTPSAARHGLNFTGINAGNGAKITGQGAGAGVLVTGGATGPGLSATSGGGNNHGILGTGTGTGSGIAGAGATNDLITNLFETLEGTEPSGAIGDNAKVMDILQYLKRYNFSKRTVTAAVDTLFKDDESTTLQTQALSNDGTTVTRGVVA